MQPALAKALVEFQSKLTSIPKNREAGVGKFSFTYSDLSDILNTIRPILSACKLSIVQNVKQEGPTLLLETTVVHESGESISMSFPFVVNTFLDMQKYGAAISYMRRYSLLCVLCLNSEDEMEQIPEGEKPIKVDQPKEEAKITEQQLETLDEHLAFLPEFKAEVMQKMKLKKLSDLPAKLFDRLLETCKRKISESTPF